jgi:pimeloyl-ACP methyl ester carboxylesterase
VADLLQQRGHEVFTPTLTGLGERSHLLSGDITLETHIMDVVSVFKWESIEDAVLCAHSYGGWPVSGALEYVHAQVSALVFLDAHLPQDGERGIDKSNHRDEIEAAYRSGRISTAQPSAAEFEVLPANRSWVDAMMTPQPIGASLQPIHLTGARERIATKLYIRTTGYPSHRFNECRDTARKNGWRVYETSCGHDMMVDEPEQLAELLIDVAG